MATENIMIHTNQPKRYSIQATSSDGVTVTVGRYEKKDEAKAAYERLCEEGFYHDICIRELPSIKFHPSVSTYEPAKNHQEAAEPHDDQYEDLPGTPETAHFV